MKPLWKTWIIIRIVMVNSKFIAKEKMSVSYMFPFIGEWKWTCAVRKWSVVSHGRRDVVDPPRRQKECIQEDKYAHCLEGGDDFRDV